MSRRREVECDLPPPRSVSLGAHSGIFLAELLLFNLEAACYTILRVNIVNIQNTILLCNAGIAERSGTGPVYKC